MLHVAFVWHMHQPYYKDTLTGEYTLPWVRLHATKDYMHLAKVLADYPSVHQTFNFVPSLVEQLLDYGNGAAEDRALRVSCKEELTAEDKQFMLDFFFSINWDRFVRRYPRYWQLLRMREEVNGSVELLSDAYWRDLIAWFNLAWIDPGHLQRDSELRGLVEKGQGFSRADIRLILDKHQSICLETLPRYRQLAEAGQVELTTSPYFHPILPLLIDTRAARVASPDLPLPGVLFACPEDASEQIRLGIELHEKVFGHRPRGLWPSEGAVSMATVQLLEARHGLRWLASDEGVLARTLGVGFDRDGYGHLADPSALYQPYTVGVEGPAIVFRDQILSDRIGFVYKQWEPYDAAADLVHRLDMMARKLEDSPEPHLATIILDGENCWEEYVNNGDDFLRNLFSMLSDHPRLRTVTVAEYLEEYGTRRQLQGLHAGSWIQGNLETWIGEPEQNRAWDYLALARARLITWQREYLLADLATLEAAWQQIYIAEGSDWFWWYYSRNHIGTENPFDVEYRGHLSNVYRVMGLPPPAWLQRPILGPAPVRSQPITAYISPRLVADGVNLPEWAGAGFIEPEIATGAMQRGATILRRLYYGYNPGELCLRLEANADLARHFVAVYLSTPASDRSNSRLRYGLTIPSGGSHDLSISWEIAVAPGVRTATASRAAGSEIWETVGQLVTAAVGHRAMEFRIPLEEIGLALGDTVGLVVGVSLDHVLAEVLPSSGAINFTLASLS